MNASSDLVTNLKNSLADSAAGWAVRRVRTQPRFGNVIQPEGGYSIEATQAVDTLIDLTAVNLRSGTGARSILELTYRSTAFAGTFTEGAIIANDGEWKTTDTALNTTILTLANTFLAAGDTALKNALAAGAVSDNTTIPAGQLTALLASLADTMHGWTCRGVTRQRNKIIVTLGTLELTVLPVIAVDDPVPVPVFLSYAAELAPDGSLILARVMFGGPEWVSRSTTLHTAVMTYADQFLAFQSSALTAALNAGPG